MNVNQSDKGGKHRLIKAAHVICITLLCSSVAFPAAAEDFTNAIRAFLQHRGEFEKRPGGIVIGIVDEHGSRIVSHGNLGDGTGREANGDTLFGMYSQTCVFTALLLFDMIERGEMHLDDPVAKYLPTSVKVPTYHGREIALRHLVTETAGLPDFLLEPKRAESPFADYTVEEMYAFLSDCQLSREPGVKYVHGGLDMGLLGHVIALKAGTNYEALLMDRLCRPLRMNDTRVVLTPEQRSRLAIKQNQAGYPMPDWDLGVLAPLAGLYSTPNDVLKFVSANLGLMPSRLTPLMEKHLTHLVWGDSPDRERGIVQFGGGGMFGGSVYSGFDKNRRHGLVVMSTTDNGRHNSRAIGRFLLESDWQSDRWPKPANISSEACASYAGQYQRSPDFAFGMFAVRQYLRHTSKAAIFALAAFSLAVLWFLLRRARSSRNRWIILGGALLAAGLVAAPVPLVAGRVFCARFQPRIEIRAEGNRLFAQATGKGLWPVDDWFYAQATGLGSQPIDVLWPSIPCELLPEADSRFFERLSGVPVHFFRDARGKATGLTLHYRGNAFSYEKISDPLPPIPRPPEPLVATRLSPEFLDACLGNYQFPSNHTFPSGMRLKVWREGDQLVAQVWGENLIKGAFNIFAASETNFFLKLNGAQLRFSKNEKGEVTAVTHHLAGYPDIEGRKLEN